MLLGDRLVGAVAQRDLRAVITDARLETGRCQDVDQLGRATLAIGLRTSGTTDIRAECWCSQISVMTALGTLPRAEVRSMIDEGQILEIRCDYCNHEYRVAPSELRGLVETN